MGIGLDNVAGQWLHGSYIGTHTPRVRKDSLARLRQSPLTAPSRPGNGFVFGALAIALVASTMSLLFSGIPLAAADAGAPVIAERVVATVYGGSITLHGEHLGGSADVRSIRFIYGPRSKAVAPNATNVQLWQNDTIILTVPPEVQSGRLIVTVNGQPSNSVNLVVFQYQTIADPPAPGTNPAPLAVAVGQDHTLWINQEFHTELHALSGGVAPALQARGIPQVSGVGIFATTLFGGQSARFSSAGEDIDIAGDGKVWFTEGGAIIYPPDDVHYNTSRIMSYSPATGQFQCFNAPFDNASVIGLLIDAARGMVWYTESGFEHGAAISGITLNSSLSNCAFDPTANGPRDPICDAAPGPSCHWRFALPDAESFPAHMVLDGLGNIWFTEYLGNKIARFNPDSGQLIELPLPAPISQDADATQYATSGPWQLTFDDHGDLWATEFFDATILRVHPDRLSGSACLQLDSAGRNPCIDEALVASNGSDGKTIHTISAGADGLLWFGLETDHAFPLHDPAIDTSVIGFVSPVDGTIGFLPQIAGLTSTAGIVQDPSTRDIWIAQFWDQAIGRLRQLGPGDADADGVADVIDNCVIVPNADQGDWNHNGLGDACEDPDIDHDGMSNAYELATPGCDPYVYTDDGDGLSTASELASGKTNPCVWDSGAWGCSHAPIHNPQCDVDTDGDGCKDAWELGPDAAYGGQRNPINPWDYFNPTGDRQNRVDDIALVASLYGKAVGMPGYTTRADRGQQIGSHAWELAPPDGRITVSDIIAAAQQFHHDCR